MEANYSTLAICTARLNADAEAANAVLNETNSRLGRISTGIPFFSLECTVWKDVDDRRKVLGYSKIDDAWQLSIHETGLGFDHGDRVMNASREIRIAAALVLPAFLKYYADHVAAIAGT